MKIYRHHVKKVYTLNSDQTFFNNYNDNIKNKKKRIKNELKLEESEEKQQK